MKKYIILFIAAFYTLVSTSAANMAQDASLSGKITDENGQALAGVNIYIPELKNGAISDENGNFVLENLPQRSILIQISSVGYKLIAEQIDLRTSTQKDFKMQEAIVEINEVVVTGQSSASQSIKTPTPISIASKKELLQQSSTNIIDAISSQPGVSQISTGSSISKPVIRGLGYNRVIVVQDGVRQEGQQWGDEHGIEIDEFDVDRVEILKGPASLIYGSDAMAGVISMLSSPILPKGKMKVEALANYQTNNGLWAYSLNFAGHKKAFVWDTRYSNKNAHAYQNKYDGYVFNSGFSEQSASSLLGFNGRWGYSHLNLSAYELTPGIVEGDRDASSGKFIKEIAVDNETTEETEVSESELKEYGHAMPYQKVNHYKIGWNSNFLLNNGSIKTNFAYQQNQRKEFEDVLKPSDYALYFQLHTINYSAQYLIQQKDNYDFSIGLNGMWQKSLNKGEEFLVPEYELFDAGIYTIANKSLGKFNISGGLRFDQRLEKGKSLYLDANEKPTAADAIDTSTKFEGFNETFYGFSGSIGASYQINKAWISKLNLSRGFRAPNISELAANGVHEGTIRYEIGNSSLKAESSLQLDYELSYTTEHINAKLNLFTNLIDNYIFSRKLLAENGSDSIIDGYNCYRFEAGNVQMSGGEFYLDIHPHPLDWLHFENSFSIVYAQQKNQPDSTKYLPFTPAPKWSSSLRADIKTGTRFLSNSYLYIGLDHYFAQDKIYSAYNTETASSQYTLINAGLGSDILWKKHKLCTIIISGTNLADIAYQSHLSRLKYAAENNLTGRTGVYNMGRNISFKLLVPVNF